MNACVCFNFLTDCSFKTSVLYVVSIFAGVASLGLPNFCSAYLCSINFLSSSLSAVLLPCQAAAWSCELSLLPLLKDPCISPAAAYILYSHWCVISFITETHFSLCDGLLWWLLFLEHPLVYLSFFFQIIILSKYVLILLFYCYFYCYLLWLIV